MVSVLINELYCQENREELTKISEEKNELEQSEKCLKSKINALHEQSSSEIDRILKEMEEKETLLNVIYFSVPEFMFCSFKCAFVKVSNKSIKISRVNFF